MKTYKRLKFKIEDDMLEECSRLPFYKYDDRDLLNAITGCAIRSIDGKPNNLFKTVPDLCSKYQYTSVCASVPNIMKAVNSFECEVGRVRILKQEPGVLTPKHIDGENWNSPPEKHLRVWIAINHNPNFKVFLGDDEIVLEKGEGVVFDPDTPHGAHNKSISNERYSLNLIVKPDEWLKNNVI